MSGAGKGFGLEDRFMFGSDVFSCIMDDYTNLLLQVPFPPAYNPVSSQSVHEANAKTYQSQGTDDSTLQVEQFQRAE